MKDKADFFNVLEEIDGQEVSSYSRLFGDFDFSRYVLKLSHLEPSVEQGATLFVVRVPQIIADFPSRLFDTPVRRAALEDYLTRKVASEIDALARYDEQGLSRRRLSVAIPGQKILPRTSLVVTEEYVEARIYIVLPSRNGRVLGESAHDIFFEDLPAVANNALIYCNLDEGEVTEMVNLMEDADQIRQMLPTRGFVSFVGADAMMTRLGNTDYPNFVNATPLSIDEALQVEMETPNTGPITGIGIPQGLTLVLGDAYSGRVEMMKAIAHGIYNHVPGDGREHVITVPDAVYVAAESGRSIQRVDVSTFFSDLPGEMDPRAYTVMDADPCTAQAASTVEALEIGARVLLFDESDASPSFLSRDSRLSGLLPEAERHITPLSMRARQLVDDLGISIVVAGSSFVAEFIPVADKILKIDGFQVEDVTEEAKRLAISTLPEGPKAADLTSLTEQTRWIIPSSVDPGVGKEDDYIVASSVDLLDFGRSTIDLHYVTQLADINQTKAIGQILYYAKQHYMDEGRPILEVLDLVDRDLSTEGLECLTRELHGNLARPRRYEVAAALNRLDTLRISPAEG